jgi:hypothetical protein
MPCHAKLIALAEAEVLEYVGESKQVMSAVYALKAW